VCGSESELLSDASGLDGFGGGTEAAARARVVSETGTDGRRFEGRLGSSFEKMESRDFMVSIVAAVVI
jgi:hypothetical protein